MELDEAQKTLSQDAEMNLKIELLKNISLAQITSYIQQQTSQSSTRFATSYQYEPSMPSSSREQSPERNTISGVTEHQSTIG